MKHPPTYWHKAKKVLSKRDPVLRKIIKKYKFISRKEAFYKLHFPKNDHDIDLAKEIL